MPFLKNLSIKIKLFLSYAVMFLLIFVLSFSLLFFQARKSLEIRIKEELSKSNQTVADMVETTAKVSIKNYLRAIAEKNREIASQFYRDFQNGEISESEAKKRTSRIMLGQSVGKTGYIYCINSTGIAEVHPQEGVRENDLSSWAFIQEQCLKKDGYLEYEWKNPDEVNERKKALYMTYFEPWDWIISVSSYKSEFMDFIGINDFKDRILNLTFGETGYSIIINSQGEIIVHPELTGNMFDMEDTNGISFVKEMIRLKTGYLTYMWKNPSEDKPREKFVAFDYIPEFDWIIISTSYTREVFAPLYDMQKIFVLILLIVFLITGGVTLAVSTSITKPLLNFVNQLERISPDDWSSRFAHEWNDEIGKLSSSFNHFMDRLERYRKTLVSEITARKKVEQRQALLAEVIEQSHDTILITDKDGKIQYANSAFEKNTGFSKENVKGRALQILNSGMQNDDFFTNMWAVLKSGKVWRGLMNNKRKDGSFMEEDVAVLPVKNTTGKIINYAAIMRDLTQVKNLERQLLQAQKMEAIGTLAGGIAHDFNNILSAIIGYSELLKFEIPKDIEAASYPDNILKAGNRAKDLVNRILTFSRQSEQELKPLSVKKITIEALKLIRASLPSTIEIHEDLISDSLIMGNSTQIHQIIMNLCTNAGHAMQENGGVLEIVLNDEVLDIESASYYTDLKPGKYLKLAVKDSGYGISPDKIDFIFDPFFTTKGKGAGTGLGLSVVHGIVKSMKGSIAVSSKPGKGALFEVLIPIIIDDIVVLEEKVNRLPQGTERVLLIDDEPELIKVGRSMLEKLGYSVYSSSNPREALNLFESEPDKYDMVITDMTMPDLTGDKLAAELIRIKNDIPVILTTGFSVGMTEEKACEIGIKGFLMKPIDMLELAGMIRKILDA